jgi:hypothetical protein
MEKRLLMSVFVSMFFLSLLVSANEVEAGLANRSEMRGILVDPPQDTDWSQVIQIAKDYNFNAIFSGCLWTYGSIYPSQYLSQPSVDQLAAALYAAHSEGIEVHCLMLVNFIWDGYGYDQPVPEDWKVTDCDGNKVNWVDPCHPDAKQFMKDITQELVTKYDIDGFHYDYIRYSGEDISYSDYCRQDFEADTGITVTTWPDDVCWGGQYRNQYMEWRISSITEQADNLKDWMTEINPDLEFSAAVFSTLYQNGRTYPTYFLRSTGQDTMNFVKSGYLDFVAPMGYTTNIDDIGGMMTGNLRYFAGGVEGKVPVVKWVSKDVTPVSPDLFKQKIDKIREVGSDGWIVWKYGGPGLTSNYEDVRPYFQLLDMPETFSLGHVQAWPESTETTVTWMTDKPTDSMVEYSTSPFFTWIQNTDYNYQCGCDFPFWDIQYAAGTSSEDSANIVTHKIKLAGLQENTLYYYRVKSTDASGTATSEVYNFTTGSGSYPITLQGTVTDSETGYPIRAIVYCNNKGGASDANGAYTINMQSTGSCDLVATSADYNTNSMQISFPSVDAYTFDIALDPLKISIGGALVDKIGNPMRADIKIFEQDTENIMASSSTDAGGNYDFSVRKGFYDVRYEISGFGSYWVKFPYTDLRRPISDKIEKATHESNRITLDVDAGAGDIVEIYVRTPKKIFINGIETRNHTSFGELTPNTWHYDSAIGKLYLKLDPYPKTECLYECCVDEQNYYDQICAPDKYCSGNTCTIKPGCPFECCVDEDQYLNKTCAAPSYCVNKACVDSSAYWKFDEGSGAIASDSSGSGNDGMINGATWETINCKAGSCLRFDGIDDYVLVTESDSLNIDGDMTIEAWVYATGWSGQYPGIISKYWPSGYLLGINNGSQSWSVWLRTTTGGFVSSASDEELVLNRWTHLAAVRGTDNVVRIYINGTAQSWQPTLTGSIVQAGTDVNIGRWGGDYFAGIIDNLKVYDRALTEAEIQTHANS